MKLTKKLGTIFGESLVIVFNIGISFYRVFLGPHLGGSCRFEPSCSAYAHEAFEKYNFIQALSLTSKRLWACRPGGRFGFDPVPKKGCCP